MSPDSAHRSSRRWLALAALVAVAAGLRLIALELRPPHHDEGVNGWFVERLLHDGAYRYDPGNYHGPSYFYLLAAARAALGFGLWQLRLPGALIGVGTCLLPLALRRRLGGSTALAAGALLAVSPTLVYFARYAIHETLLAALGLVVAVAVLRWAEHGRAAWLALAGAALAGMVATKETTIVFLGVSGLWLVAEIAAESVRARRLMILGRRPRWSWRVPAIAAAIALLMAAIHVVLFTGALRAPGSIEEQLRASVRAYFVWARTGVGESGHDKPGCYYLHLGARYELGLYLLAAIGLVTGRRDRAIRALGVVGFGLLAAYSLIAYKMPWLPVSWLVLLAIPAAHGLAAVGRRLADELSPRLGARAALALALIPAAWITVRSSFVDPTSPREDLAYVHTHRDYNAWFGFIERGARAVGARRLAVAVEHEASWPLAWSLLPYDTRWGVRGDEDVAIVAIDRGPAVEARLRGAYLRRRYQLRDAAPPIYVYLRQATYAPLLDARARRGFVAIEGGRAAAIAAR